MHAAPVALVARSVGSPELAEAEPVPGTTVTARVTATRITAVVSPRIGRRRTAASLAAGSLELAAPCGYAEFGWPGRLGRSG